jgi:hypothetical protein
MKGRDENETGCREEQDEDEKLKVRGKSQKTRSITN